MRNEDVLRKDVRRIQLNILKNLMKYVNIMS